MTISEFGGRFYQWDSQLQTTETNSGYIMQKVKELYLLQVCLEESILNLENQTQKIYGNQVKFDSGAHSH